MAMENQPFIDDVPINSSIARGFSAAIFDYRMVTCSIQKKTVKPKFLTVAEPS